MKPLHMPYPHKIFKDNTKFGTFHPNKITLIRTINNINNNENYTRHKYQQFTLHSHELPTYLLSQGFSKFQKIY